MVCSSATLSYAQDQWASDKIYGICQPENERSIRLLEKLGLSYERTYCMPDDDQGKALYSINNI